MDRMKSGDRAGTTNSEAVTMLSDQARERAGRVGFAVGNHPPGAAVDLSSSRQLLSLEVSAQRYTIKTEFAPPRDATECRAVKRIRIYTRCLS
jgi:hypothetical protein